MEKKLRSVWPNQVSAYVHRMLKTVAARLRARAAFHFGILALIAFVLSLRVFVPWFSASSQDAPLPTAVPTQLPDVVASSPTAVPNVERSHATSAGQAVARDPPPIVRTLFQSPVTRVAIPDGPRTAVVTYTVQTGDSVATIARRFGLKRETLIWSNKEVEADPGMLYIGQILDILPVDGVYYTIKEGETLDQIAARFGVTAEAIAGCECNAQALRGADPVPGRKLVVPGGVQPFRAMVVELPPVPVVPEVPRAMDSFVWPVGGYISQGYWDLHRAIDIAGGQGADVVAADAGTVVYAKWESSGYGYLVIVDHGNGYTTYYAHLYGYYVDVGDTVEQGQPLGVRGTTGRSTGPHLHFEIRKDGVQVNPLGLLPKH